MAIRIIDGAAAGELYEYGRRAIEGVSLPIGKAPSRGPGGQGFGGRGATRWRSS